MTTWPLVGFDDGVLVGAQRRHQAEVLAIRQLHGRRVVKALHNDSRLRAEYFSVAEATLRMIETAIICTGVSRGQYSMHEANVLGMAQFRLDVVSEIATRKVERDFAIEPLEVTSPARDVAVAGNRRRHEVQRRVRRYS